MMDQAYVSRKECSDCEYRDLKNCTTIVSKERRICTYHEGMFGLITKKRTFSPIGYESFFRYETYLTENVCKFSLPLFKSDNVVLNSTMINEITAFFDTVKRKQGYLNLDVERAVKITEHLLISKSTLDNSWLSEPGNVCAVRPNNSEGDYAALPTINLPYLHKLLLHYTYPSKKEYNAKGNDCRNTINNLECILNVEKQTFSFNLSENVVIYSHIENPKAPEEAVMSPLVLFGVQVAQPEILDDKGEFNQTGILNISIKRKENNYI